MSEQRDDKHCERCGQYRAIEGDGHICVTLSGVRFDGRPISTSPSHVAPKDLGCDDAEFGMSENRAARSNARPITELRNYPNLEAIVEGRVSGAFREWPMIADELRLLFHHIAAPSNVVPHGCCSNNFCLIGDERGPDYACNTLQDCPYKSARSSAPSTTRHSDLADIEEALWALHSYESNRDDAGRSYSEADITKMVSALRASVPSAIATNADTTRLDFMERHLCRAGEVKNSAGQTVKLARVWSIMGELETLRETVDAMMAATDDGGEA